VRLDPREVDALRSARFGALEVTSNDFVFADTDGALFVAATRVAEVLETARSIFEIERRQAEAVQRGSSLRGQLRFDEFLARRATDPGYTLRKHLRGITGAIEE
jgi:hypothetical protein